MTMPRDIDPGSLSCGLAVDAVSATSDAILSVERRGMHA
jgi:hypothetical protein